MKYLGFPISDKRLGCGTFRDITCKMRKKLQPWKGKNLTSGGSLILTNSSLSSMPIYMMSIFHLYGEIHRRMDTIRSKFFCGSDGDKFRYHMVSVGEFRKTRHPRNVELNKVLKACFSGAGNSRFSEAWNL
jgi:hypothetical protein